MPCFAGSQGDKKKEPSCHLSWLINDNLAAILESAQDVDERIFFARKRWGKLSGMPEFLAFLRDLRQQPFDVVLDLQGLFRSGLCTAFTRAGQKVGFAAGRELSPWFYGEKVKVPEETVHAVDKNLHLAGEAFGTIFDYEAPRFALDEAVQQEITALMDEHDLQANLPLLAVAPSSRWQSKCWPPTFFAEVIAQVYAELNGQVCCWLLGTNDEAHLGNTIVDTLPKTVRPVNLMGQTSLPVMMGLLQRSTALVANDSGPMHLAVALSTPVAACYGPTSPEKTGPYGSQHRVFQGKVVCAPCFKRECPLPEQICQTQTFAAGDVAHYIVSCCRSSFQ